MAFLDNSGDIILDAVLTDAGRQRMAKGNFRIVKFALGDEEINYNIFNGGHPSGSAFYDLEIMQTPVLESFTNNTSLMKSKLVTMTRNNILYMPMFKINNDASARTATALEHYQFSGYLLAADLNSETNGDEDNPYNLERGVLRGQGSIEEGDGVKMIAVDQGIDTSESGLTNQHEMPDDLVETAFLIKCDHRLLRIHQVGPRAGVVSTTSALPTQFIDDDGIASYYVSLSDGTTCVEGAPRRGAVAPLVNDGRVRAELLAGTRSGTNLDNVNESFLGPLGSILRIYPRTSTHVQRSPALFDQMGRSSSSQISLKDTDGNAGPDATANMSYKYIDTLINVVGVTTGYSIDIPIRIVKKV